jgi:hypothetical protein
MGEVFTDDSDPAARGDGIGNMGRISTRNGVIVFCVDMNGRAMYSQVSQILSPLFTSDRILIATFDFVMDLIALDTIGVTYRKDRVIDCQLYGLPRGEEYLTYTRVNSLGARIGAIDLDDPMLERAHEIGAEGKQFPWDAYMFIMLHDNLPPTSLVTRQFLEYSANDIVLTSLVYAEVKRDGHVGVVMDQTREKLGEYERAQSQFGQLGPHLVRQVQFRQRDWSVLRGPLVRAANTLILLERWRKLRDILELTRYANGTLLTIDVRERKLVSMVKDTARILSQPDRLDDIRFLAPIAHPPRS